MPKQLKTKTTGQFVEVNLKIAKNKYPLVSEALAAVLALAGQQMEKPGEAKEAKPKAAARKVGRPKAKAGRPKAAKSRRPASEKKPISPETAALLRDLRVKAGLSQKALAVKSKVSQNQVSLLETGKQRLSPTLAKKLGRVFKAPLPTE